MSLQNEVTGEVLDNERVQGWLREIYQRKGKLILSSPVPPQIGEVQEFAGLPMRVVRHATTEEARENCRAAWPDDVGGVSDEHFHFEVEVAD